MNREELMRLLDVKPEAVKQGTVKANPGSGEKGSSPSPINSDTALILDKWDVARGNDALDRSPRAKQHKLTAAEMADFHGCAFLGSPTLTEQCSDTRRHQYVNTLLESPECKALRTSTVYNTLASEMAATEFGVAYANLKKEDEERKKKGKPKTEAAKERDEMRAEASMMKAVGRAIDKATQEVEDLEDMMAALGCGNEQGTNTKVEIDRIGKLFQRVRNNVNIRRIIELAGRYRRVAQAKQRQKVKHGYDDVVGVVPGGDIGRLTITELACLADDDLFDDTARRIIERQAMCREYRGIEKLGKGPIIAEFDESGSMGGEPNNNAKGFALSLAWVAQHQKRWCYLGAFSCGRHTRGIVLPPGKWDQNALLDWLGGFINGGTSMDVPLSVVPNELWPKLIASGMKRGKVDMFVVTDAIVNVPPYLRDPFNAWKKAEQVRLYTLLIGGYGAGDMASVSDEVYPMEAVTVNSEAVGRCLSI